MSRDTSAFTTLDNANMGTREDFEKWAAEEGRSIKRSNPDYAPKPYASAATNNALDGWEARQPEIDALKAENERLRNALVRLLASTDKGNSDTHEHGCMCVYHEAEAATKDFLTTKKEEWRGSEEN